MVNNKTYNNVVNTLVRMADGHQQVSTVSVGDIYDIDLENHEVGKINIKKKIPGKKINSVEVLVKIANSN